MTFQCNLTPLGCRTTLPEGNATCQCEPPTIAVTSPDVPAEFQLITCQLTQDLIQETNPDSFFFPRSRQVHIDCTWNNSLGYHNFLKSVAKESGDIANEIDTVGYTNCFMPFTITAATYIMLPRLQKLSFHDESVDISSNSFLPLERLELLSLTHLHLKYLHSEVFRGLTHLRVLSLWDNDLRELPDGIFHDLQDLQSLSIANNSLVHISRDLLMPLEFLNILYLNGNNISFIHKDAFRPLRSLEEVNLSYNNLDETFLLSFIETRKLSLSHNSLTRVTEDTFAGVREYTGSLDLSYNLITSIAETIFLDTPNLTQVYLHGNLLTVIPSFHSLPKSLEIMSLQHNPLVCSCNLISYQGLTRYTPGVDGNATCKQKGNAFVTLGQVNSSYCRKGGINPIHTVLISLGTVTGVIAVVFMCFVIYKKNETLIKLMLLEYFPEDMSDEDANKPFDVFISYSQLDDEYVLRYLVPLLENEEEASYSICLHHRHFIPGDAIANNIVSAVAQSRRVILVLSKNFLESDWCMYEFRMAHLQALQDRRNTLLIITLGDICEDNLDPDLKAHLRTTTYLESSDSKFKHKLFLALKRRRSKRVTSNNQMGLIDLEGL
ncbi:toll-like receptor Tollo [Lytechinus variegatus]|uniref:toll-like receptor Tollo n=1 Tax=Lytechinus variegatus TaxID=7654 RepID=UPI001BB0D8E4|nr:toll-like receptor Tollo [Lytechinus variegatus]